jgi:citrate synthase
VDAKGSNAIDECADLINAALILCADFELTPGSFAARVAASAGADLYAAVAAGLSAHAGAITGRGSDRAEDLLDGCTRGTLERDLEALRRSGRKLYGFNHPLFPKGDPRALALIDMAQRVRPMNTRMRNAMRFLDQAADRCNAHPALGVGLAVFCCALGMPRRSAAAIWAVARVAGQIGHVLEQRSQGILLRPRAHYQPLVSPA